MTAEQSKEAERENTVNGGHEKSDADIGEEEVESHGVGESQEKT